MSRWGGEAGCKRKACGCESTNVKRTPVIAVAAHARRRTLERAARTFRQRVLCCVVFCFENTKTNERTVKWPKRLKHDRKLANEFGAEVTCWMNPGGRVYEVNDVAVADEL